MNLLQRVVVRTAAWLTRLANVSAVAVGKPNDGLMPIAYSGTEFDKPWGDLRQEFSDAREAWQKNALARRIVGLIRAYVVGDGITLASDYGPLAKFIEAMWAHPMNNMMNRQAQLCEELSRSGELFITLHTNRADGMSYVRAIPAGVIDKVTWRPGDYETELSYHEVVPVDDPDYGNGGRTWISPEYPAADGTVGGVPGQAPGPVMLHFAVNRPVGCVRGESDLAAILIWLKRYSNWLEDRVRLNAVVRAFVWVVKVAKGTVPDKEAKWRRPPEPGSVVVIENGEEDWQAVAPDLNATDAANDGKAIRWQIAAGGPGIGLSDLGEADESNLATATAMGEMRRRFMSERQGYFGYVLAHTTLTAYNRAVRLGLVRGREKGLLDIRISYPDIGTEDNGNLAQAASQIADALSKLQTTASLDGETWRRQAMRLVMKFAGEPLLDKDLDAMIEESGAAAEAGAGETDVSMAPLQPDEIQAMQATAREYHDAALLLAGEPVADSATTTLELETVMIEAVRELREALGAQGGGDGR